MNRLREVQSLLFEIILLGFSYIISWLACRWYFEVVPQVRTIPTFSSSFESLCDSFCDDGPGEFY